jgi:basic membrane protein A
MGVVAVLAVVAAACAQEEEPVGGGGGQAKPGADVLACQVTDVGGIDDKSFNATAYAGLTRAESELGTEISFLESQAQTDYAPNIDEFIAQECDLIVTVGFLLGDATATAAEANPEQKFAIVDNDLFDIEAGEDLQFDNVRELTFATDEAAFLAGYLAAGMTQSGKVGTFGGIQLPTVTIFMDGFAKGVAHHNEEKGTDVQVLGWNTENEEGLFTGDFENQDNGRRVTEDLISEGADIILPVAGPVGLGAAAAAQDAGGVNLIWVDTDGCVSAEEYCSLFLTSIEKHMDVAVFDTIQSVVDDSFQSGLYIGTLENDGVGISAYHEFEGQVPAELAAEIEDLKQQIISGELSLED